MWAKPTAAMLIVFSFGSAPALAQDCAPWCDFYHDYGPYKIGPDVYCRPRCGPGGNCAPFLVCERQGVSAARRANRTHSNSCLPDASRCTSNYDCCSQSCGWSDTARAFLCYAGGFLAIRHPPRPGP
jgi:hypothetical protein